MDGVYGWNFDNECLYLIMRTDECEGVQILWIDCMDGFVKMSAYILWTHPNWTGGNEWMSQNQKCTV